MAQRPIYSVRQCWEIYDRIQLPQQHLHAPGNQSRMVATGVRGLEFLRALQQAFLLKVPFENLDLHYSKHKTISVDPEAIYSKIVGLKAGRARGGYCSENNNLFAIFLRSLGFSMYMISARVSYTSAPGSSPNDPRFAGLGHQATIVTVQGRRYLVDMGFGNGGPTSPLLLQHEAESLRLPPSLKARMVYKTLPGAESESAEKVWVYEHTLLGKPELGWVPGYCFPDVECTHEDFEFTNHFFSRSKNSWLTSHVVCSKFIADEGENMGHRTVFGDECKAEWRGEKRMERRFASEHERVEGLRDLLGLELNEQQRKAIRGMAMEL